MLDWFNSLARASAPGAGDDLEQTANQAKPRELTTTITVRGEVLEELDHHYQHIHVPW